MNDYKSKMPTRSDGIYEALNNEEPASSGLIASTRAAAKSVLTMLKRVSAQDGDNDRTCLDVALSDGNANGIDADNPLPVFMTDSPATEIESQDTQNAAKDGGEVTHEYITTSEFRGLNATGSSAGLAKFTLQVETGPATGLFTVVDVKRNSTANPNVELGVKYPKAIASGVKIQIIKRNDDNQQTDLDSTINGTEQ